MELSEYRSEYRGMSAADVRRLIAASPQFRKDTEALYTAVYHRKLNKSCGDCWFDAYVVLMTTDINKLQAMKEKRFDLRAGAVLTDPYGDPAKTITARNVTDELALYHLRTHPECIRFFSVYPQDWEALAVASSEEISSKPGTIQPAPAPESKPKKTKKK